MVMQETNAPKYEQAYRVLLNRLKSGRYPIGGRLPSEGELATQFDVSRVTIRRSLDMLVQDGYVESRQGSGYKVLTLSPASDTCRESFTDAVLRAGQEPTTQLLSITNLPPGSAGLKDLPDDLQTVAVTRINRLRLVDGKPRMLVMTYAPAEVMDDARPEDFPESGPDQSILRILTARFQLRWAEACENISPVAADDTMADVLGVTVGEPLLKQSCSAFDGGGRTVFHEDVFRTGSVSFNLSQSARTVRQEPAW